MSGANYEKSVLPNEEQVGESEIDQVLDSIMSKINSTVTNSAGIPENGDRALNPNMASEQAFVEPERESRPLEPSIIDESEKTGILYMDEPYTPADYASSTSLLLSFPPKKILSDATTETSQSLLASSNSPIKICETMLVDSSCGPSQPMFSNNDVCVGTSQSLLVNENINICSPDIELSMLQQSFRENRACHSPAFYAKGKIMNY